MAEPLDDRTAPGDPLAALRARLRAFVDERDWAQFHSPKNLAMALVAKTASKAGSNSFRMWCSRAQATWRAMT